MKRFGAVALAVLILATSVSGCSSVQKKFTRKKVQPDHKPATIYIEQGQYQKKFSSEYYYKTHFSMWKNWQSDLIDQLGGNNKKVARCVQEAMGHLVEMNRYLIPEKQEELAPYMNELSRIQSQIERAPVSDSEIGNIRSNLERLQRQISSNFYYEKVKDGLVPDTVDLSGGVSP